MSSISNVDFAPYSTGGQNLKRAMGVSALKLTHGGPAGMGSDLLHKSLMDREGMKVETKPAIASTLKKTVGLQNFGVNKSGNGLEQTVLGGKIGNIVSKLI